MTHQILFFYLLNYICSSIFIDWSVKEKIKLCWNISSEELFFLKHDRKVNGIIRKYSWLQKSELPWQVWLSWLTKRSRLWFRVHARVAGSIWSSCVWVVANLSNLCFSLPPSFLLSLHPYPSVSLLILQSLSNQLKKQQQKTFRKKAKVAWKQENIRGANFPG